MRFYHVAIKSWKEIVRDRRGLALLLAFPAVFMLVFGFAFSAGGQDTSPYRIGVINEDRGTTLVLFGEVQGEQNFGEELINTLEGLTFEGTEVPMFELRHLDEKQANKLLKDRDIACLLIIPPNLSRAMNQLIKRTVRVKVTSYVGERVLGAFSGGSPFPEGSGFSDGSSQSDTGLQLPEVEEVTASLVIKGDKGYISYGQVRGILSGAIAQFKTQIKESAREQTISHLPSASSLPTDFLTVASEGIAQTQQFSTFDYQAPGIFVFALLMGAIGVAAALAREIENGTLERLNISRMSSFDLLFGTLMAWTVLSVLQVFILFAVALAIGFNFTGGLEALLWSAVIATLAGAASTSLGLLIAAFADNEKNASNLGILTAVPISFVIGAFFPLPEVTLGRFSGVVFEIYDFLPWTHAAKALRKLLTYGAEAGEITFNLSLLVILTTVLFSAGVFFFSQNRLSARS